MRLGFRSPGAPHQPDCADIRVEVDVTRDHGQLAARQPTRLRRTTVDYAPLWATVAFVDKWPAFAGEDGQASDSRSPGPVEILCAILTLGDSTATSGTVKVSVAPWRLESIDGHIEFEVAADQLISS
ncbi:hypothetical protein [Streptomyces sp. AK02-04a]|uniref:hypothetical protein n=1 Tax=Streptomyces sp. AK02-04a TaxID=3028649 RepID=UPI0029B7CDD9|nr:hypothetical protein [Streptomyces sp. AK02-04a]MDX3759659.1 hypothetical protein [Streptomyces sp. AK02-04a]